MSEQSADIAPVREDGSVIIHRTITNQDRARAAAHALRQAVAKVRITEGQRRHIVARLDGGTSSQQKGGSVGS